MRPVGWLSAAALIAGSLAISAVNPRYESHALISLRAPLAFNILQSGEASLLSRQALAATIVGFDLYPEERARSPLEDVEEGMLRDIVLSTPPSSDRNQAFLNITYFYRNPAKAQAVVKLFVSIFTDNAQLAYREASKQWEQESRIDNDQFWLDEIARLKARIAVLEMHAGLPQPQTVVTPAAPRPKQAFAIELLTAPSLASRPLLPWPAPWSRS